MTRIFASSLALLGLVFNVVVIAAMVLKDLVGDVFPSSMAGKLALFLAVVLSSACSLYAFWRPPANKEKPPSS